MEYIFNLRFYCVKEGLKKITRLLELLGNPHKTQKIIRVIGTNGKGSVSAMLSSILVEAGYRVGMNTSPHLVEFTERIRINERQIPKEDVIALSERCRPLVEEMEQDPQMGCPTYFEVTTAMALEYFREKEVEVTILEAGIGGKSDGTHITEPILVVLTRIDMDHADKLGDSLEEIIKDKAGAVPVGGNCITCNPPDILDVVERTIREKKASLWSISRDDLININSGPMGTYFSLRTKNRTYDNIFVPLPGEFQAENGALAIAAVEELIEMGYHITKEQIRVGIANTKWRGRMEVLRRKPYVLVDCAHNPNAIARVKKNLARFGYKKLHLILGMCEEKDVSSVLREIIPVADTVIFTKANTERAVPPEELSRMIGGKGFVTNNIEEAMAIAMNGAAVKDMILVCGSVYLVGETMSVFSCS